VLENITKSDPSLLIAEDLLEKLDVLKKMDANMFLVIRDLFAVKEPIKPKNLEVPLLFIK